MKYLMTYENYSILGGTEIVKICNDNGDCIEREARIDTGSLSSRISTEIAAELRLPIVKSRKMSSTLGEEVRPFVELQFEINGIMIKTIASVCDTSRVKHEVIIGRRDIEMIDGIIDLKKNSYPIEIPDTIPANTSAPDAIINVVMTTDDLDILSQNPNVNIDGTQF